MNSTEEIIDSFLRGDLSDAEATAFNKLVASDPKLQQEISIQRDIIDSVKQYRHQQLKDRLNSIDIKPAGVGFYSSAYVKLAASIGLVALIVGSFAWFANSRKNTSAVESSTTGTQIKPQAKSGETDIASAETTVSTKPEPGQKPASLSTNVTTSKIESSSISSVADKSNQKHSNTSTSQKEDVVYDVLVETPMDSDNSIEGITDNFDMPVMNHGGNTSTISSPQIKVSIIKENNLGYRFFNNQLFLHGNFSNSTYELFELNNKPSKQLFLYFENNYYELIQGKTKVTSLTPITDKTILLQLTQLRAH